ncbi:PRC-barrel domain-containing protein [Roseivivax isoporae]|uniref:PRC-barrel domain-containing protein n=1 Tax=Roseivivax isoporae LMG 25204 TaxID=1449351 RepID=X7F7K8_9RHOB|nr:PRC-barrel domain-containing protein [Roseivivax isoporae]ETX28024.1 hypothetical protein RISW2_10430 [Roseivivax isoporae LMG 25204]
MLRTVSTIVLAAGLPVAAIAQDTSQGNTQTGSQGTAQTQGDTQTQGNSQYAGQSGSGSDYQSGSLGTENLENVIRASEIQGSEVYTVGNDYDMSTWEDTPYYEEVETEWEQVGTVTDIAMTPDGKMTGLIVEHGGFLDIGDDHVLLNLDDAKFASIDEDNAYSFVTRYSGDELEQMQEVEENWW